MNTLEILEKVKALVEKWDKISQQDPVSIYALPACCDFKSLQNEIEAALDKEAEEMYAHYHPEADNINPLSHENQK